MRSRRSGQALQEFPEMAGEMQKMLAATGTPSGHTLQMFFRMGYADPVPVAPRRPLNDIIRADVRRAWHDLAKRKAILRLAHLQLDRDHRSAGDCAGGADARRIEAAVSPVRDAQSLRSSAAGRRRR